MTAQSALAAAGVARGDRVLVTARNTPAYLLTWFALMRIGAIQVPVNPANTVAELAGLIMQVEPVAVVTDEDRVQEVWNVCTKMSTKPRQVVDVGSLFAGEPADVGVSPVDPDDVAVMIPTSGTTGKSKLVMQTHLAYTMAGEGFPWWMGLTASDRLMTCLPLFHINAPAYSVLGSIASRASLVLLPKFSASRFLDQAREFGATEFNAIGAMLEILMRQEERPDDADNPLRLCYTGPSPAKARQLEMERRFGIEILCGYALSESPYGLIWPRGSRLFETLGKPRQHPTMGTVNEARVVSDSGHAVRLGEIGELELRNPTLMPGYFRMPAETDKVLVNGWLRTGDLVQENGDGSFTFVARKKEVLRRRGENLSPAEVEDALTSHPGVSQAAVIGVPSELSEEEIKAFVVPSLNLDVGQLRSHVASRLAPYKVPRYIELVDELPLTPTGRIAKHRLPRERTMTEHDFAAAAPLTVQEETPQ